MLTPSILSRPVYSGLTPDANARRNIICAEADGAQAVLDMAAAAPRDFFQKADLVYVAAGAGGKHFETALQALAPGSFWQAPTRQTLLVRLQGLLAGATMGTRLYVTGTEGFMGEAVSLATAHGLHPRSILSEHRGSEARRVQCVHCKGITENVTTNPAECSHCGAMLFVRDHFSRRIGAFQGVCIDAEIPGNVPPVEEMFK